MKLRIVVPIFICFLLITGCSNKNEINNIMKAPKLSREQLQISELIDKFIPKNAKLIVPSYGENQKSIEYVDLDGDKKSEAIIFFKEEGKELYDYKVECLILKQMGDKWDKGAYIKNYGNTFDSVIFKDINNDGKKEIILAYKIEGSSVENIGIYQEEKGEFKEIFSGPCLDFVIEDLDMDGLMELVVFDDDKEKCSLYKFDNQALTKMDEAIINNFDKFSTKIQTVDKNHKGILLKTENSSKVITVNNNKLVITN